MVGTTKHRKYLSVILPQLFTALRNKDGDIDNCPPFTDNQYGSQTTNDHFLLSRPLYFYLSRLAVGWLCEKSQTNGRGSRKKCKLGVFVVADGRMGWGGIPFRISVRKKKFFSFFFLVVFCVESNVKKEIYTLRQSLTNVGVFACQRPWMNRRCPYTKPK